MLIFEKSNFASIFIITSKPILPVHSKIGYIREKYQREAKRIKLGPLITKLGWDFFMSKLSNIYPIII